MTIFPQYLSEYPNMNSSFPFHLSIHHIERRFASHRHDYLEFSYVIDGQGYEIVNGVRHDMVPGTFTFVLPYQIHEIYASPNQPLKLFNCMFGMNILFDTNSDMGLRDILLESGEHFPAYVHFQNDEHRQMEQLLFEVMHEYNEDALWKKALLRAKLVEVLVRFDRLRRERHHIVTPVTTQHGHSKIWQVVNYIHHHYQEELTLGDLSKQFHFSTSHLSESFKRFVGKNFVDFLHELRIRHACGLLSSTEMNISDIALEVGYGSYNTFARVFRQKKGQTPQDYRNNKKSA